MSDQRAPPGAVAHASRRSRRLIALVVAIVALLARVSYETALHHDTGAVGTMAANLLGDERAYDGFARKVAAGTLDRERAFYQEPLYAWSLGQIYRLFPPSPVAPGTAVVPKEPVHEGVIAGQHLLGVLLAVAVALLGCRCLGAPAGLLAGLFAALSGPTIFAESMLLKEGAALLLWVLSLHLWLDVLTDRPVSGAGDGGAVGAERTQRARPALGRSVVLGLALGLGVLLRGNTYLLLGAVLLSLLMSIGGRRRLLPAALVLFCALLALLPATVHNLRRGDFVLSTYQAGSNAAIGQPDGDEGWRGVAYEPLLAGHGDAAFEESDAVSVAEAATGRRMTGREISAWWWREVARRAASRPAVTLERIARKLAHTFHGDEVPDVKDWNFTRSAVPWLGTPLSDLSWLGPLALLGFLALPWRPRGLLVVRGSVLVVMASLALFYVMGRYRLSAAPGLWILAAGVIVGGTRLLIGTAPLPRKLAGAALAVGVVLLGQIEIRPDSRGLQVSWSNVASIELARARRAVDAADARAHRDAAVAAARQSILLAPGYPEGRDQLISALDANSPVLQPRGTEAWEEAWRLLLVMQAERTGTNVAGIIDRPLPAVITAADQLRTLPGIPERQLYVAAALARADARVAQGLKDAEAQPAALALLDEAISLQPDEGRTHLLRGLVLKRLGRFEEAEQACRRALELGEDSIELHNNLGNLLLGMGRVDEAQASFERALALEPGNATVLENLERVRAARQGP